MAPTRPHSKNAKSKAARRMKKQQQSSRSPKQLLADATASLEQGDAAAAAVAATAALEAIEGGGGGGGSGPPQQGQLAAAALTLLGEIHLELGDPDSARAFFARAVEADNEEAGDDEVEALLASASAPSGGGAAAVSRAEKFLWLAQLSEDGGADSVRWYERGAGVLRAQLALLDEKATREGPAPSPSSSSSSSSAAAITTAAQPQPGQRRRELLDEARRDVSRRLASALCAVAEVYMTDLSWEADAEQRCEALVTEATMLAPDFPDAWQTVASVRISQGHVDDARAALRRSMEPWAAALLADDDKEGEGEAAAAKGDKAAQPPPFPTRVSLVRLLMEVEWEDKAVEVAETLAREDDQSVEALYLGGFGQYVLGEKLGGGSTSTSSNGDGGEVEEERRAVWRSARRWLKQCLALFAQQDYEDERLGEHAQELFATLNKELGLKPDDDDDDDDDDGWEDDEDGDEEME